MRVLWIAPWFRTLARVWAGPLRAAGHEVLVVTSPRHFEPFAEDRSEVVLGHGPRTLAGWRELAALRRRVAAFDPQVVVADELRDPRLLLLTGACPLVLLVHDARPHDEQHRRPWRHERVVRRQHAGATRVVVFSEAVRRALGTGDGRVRVLPLPSEMPDALVAPPVGAAHRRDVVVAGRLGPYKNLAVVMQAWARHAASAAYRGDRLLLLGDGEVPEPLPAGVHWQRGRFAFRDAAPVVAAAKASLSFYRAGSQSGVAIWSMQLGTAAVVSDVGGLAEYLPPGEGALGPDDVAGLADRLGVLADPAAAAAAGRRAAEHYRACCAAPRSAGLLAAVLAEAAGEKR